MVDWKQNLKNISKPDINLTEFTNSERLPEYIIEKNKESAPSSWLSFTTITLFLVGLFAFSRKNGFIQAIMIISYCCLMISLAFILSGWVKNIYPFFLFSIIWLVSVVVIFNSKENNKI